MKYFRECYPKTPTRFIGGPWDGELHLMEDCIDQWAVRLTENEIRLNVGFLNSSDTVEFKTYLYKRVKIKYATCGWFQFCIFVLSDISEIKPKDLCAINNYVIQISVPIRFPHIKTIKHEDLNMPDRVDDRISRQTF